MIDLPLSHFLEPLEQANLPYFVTGSVAAMIYGEPRTTQGVDLVLFLPASRSEDFTKLFPLEDFYCPPEDVIAIEAKRPTDGHFNIIHHESGFKADIYLSGNDPLHTWALKKRRNIELDGITISIAPPEFVILKKLAYFRDDESSKHPRDIRAICELLGDALDKSFIAVEAERLGLLSLWRDIRSH